MSRPARTRLRRGVPVPGPQGPDPAGRPRVRDADLQRLHRRRTSSAPTRTEASRLRRYPIVGMVIEASARRSVSRVLSRRAPSARGDGHPSGAAGRPTAHAADPRAGQRTSPPRRSPAAGCALLFGLAPGGVCRVSLRRRPEGRRGIVTVALVLASRRTGVTRHPALRSSDFPHAPTGRPDRPRDHPTASLTSESYPPDDPPRPSGDQRRDPLRQRGDLAPAEDDARPRSPSGR